MTSSNGYTRYSQETMLLIKNYMETAKLTTLQQKIILDSVRKGKPIPSVTLVKLDDNRKANLHVREIYFAKRIKKRTLDAIRKCGAYDIDAFIPVQNSAFSREKEIERLQNICSGIEEILEDGTQVDEDKQSRVCHTNFSKQERIRELMNEIKQRIEFLNEMEKLGLKRKYEFEISSEIAEKLRHLENLRKT